MKYNDGTEARCGDIISYDTVKATVVVNIDTEEFLLGYEDEYKEMMDHKQEGRLLSGILVDAEGIGLVLFSNPIPSLTVVTRSI